MKDTEINLLHKAIVSIFVSLLAAPAFSQEISYATILPTENAQCIDYPPLGDGFGWNGRCGCMVDPVWTEFGSEVAISGNTIAIGSADTPENCPGSDATVSIYEKSESGSWVKDTEFNFEDENTGVGDFEFADGKLVIKFGSNKSRVFEKLSGEWQQVSTLDANAGSFVRRHSVDATNRTRVMTFGDVDLNGNETIQSQVEVESRLPVLVSRYGDIAVGLSDEEVFFFSENSSGNWQLDSQIAFPYPKSSIVLQGSIIVFDLSENMHVWHREGDGAWVKSEVFDTNLPILPWLSIVAFEADNKLLVTSPEHFRTYNFNSENKLVEIDRLELPGEQWYGVWRRWSHFDFPSTSAINEHVDFDGAHLLVGNRYNNIANVFEVSSNGVFGEANDESASEEECSYVDAAIYDGWGWNAIAGVSCPPVNNDPVVDNNESLYDDVACIDTDGDGWGWQKPDNAPGRSCVVAEASNDSVYDGVACIDIDGDGWGWQKPEGVEGRSCKIP